MDACGHVRFSELWSRRRPGDSAHGIQFLTGLKTLWEKEKLELQKRNANLADTNRGSGLKRTLESSFNQFYIDPHNYALSTAEMLKKMMDNYLEDNKAYVAPYTSLVTSSMMGKSRLMKEMSNHIPCLYICLRSEGSSGYPQRSFQIAQWFDKSLGLKAVHMQADFEHHLPSVKYAAFLVSLMDALANLASPDNDDMFDNKLHIGRSNLHWMWAFFAEPPNSLTETKARLFWTEVISAASARFKEHFRGPSHYLNVRYPRELSTSYDKLRSAFKRWTPKDFTLILLFDEARRLCDISAYDGKRIPNEESYDEQGCRILRADSETAYMFSNFGALSQASRYSLLCERRPRIFSLFTDTTSRISDFQPQPQAAFGRSSRMFTVPPPGIKQFEPIFAFTSLDAHAQLRCSSCVSDIYEVSDPERMIKFGRAGWYSTYAGEFKKGEHYFDMELMTMFAGNKLLFLPNNSRSELKELVRTQKGRKLQLKLLALLGVRLDIAVDPFTTEAGELVDSHLAVLIDATHSYLKTAYASEPILAAVASQHIADIGWHYPLEALCHYIDSAVVSPGFRGELLTKVICLMTMDGVIRSVDRLDTVPKSLPSGRPDTESGQPDTESGHPDTESGQPDTERPPTKRSRHTRQLSVQPASAARPTTREPPYRWRYTQPVKVNKFLDSLLAPPPGYKSFSSALVAKQKDLSLNSAKLRKFLDGYVFFNHFMHLDTRTRLSIEMMARAWNRGAALSCKDYTTDFDHAILIPVMLAQPNTKTAFGPMFDPWDSKQITEGCRHMSMILIQSKNYANQNAPTATNFDNKKEFDAEKNVYLSLLQDFGPIHRTDKGPVTILSPKITREKQEPEHQQIVVTAKGFDGQTYECLRDSGPISEEKDSATVRIAERQLIQRSIEQLKKSVEFCDKDRKLAVKEGFFGLGLTGPSYRKIWEAEVSKFESLRKQPQAEDIDDVEMANVQSVQEDMLMDCD